MTPDTEVNSIEDLRGILSKIRFAPSCLDFGWDWEVSVYCQELDGWNVRATFRRPDTNTGEVGTGRGRWWFVLQGSTSSGLVKTAWLAFQQVVHHELMEAFMFDGVRVFDPHAEVGALCDANRPPRPWRSGVPVSHSREAADHGDHASNEVRKGTEIMPHQEQVHLVKTTIQNAFLKSLGNGFEDAPWNCAFLPQNEESDIQPHWKLQTTRTEFFALQQALMEGLKALRNFKGKSITLKHGDYTLKICA